MGRGGRVEADRPAGSAELVLSAGVRFLQPQEAVLEAMLTGWEAQQRSRLLAAHTLWQRRLVVRRLVAFTNDYPWAWTPAEVEAWTSEMVGRGLTHATIRNYQAAVALFLGYVVDARYGWGRCARSISVRIRSRCSTSGTPPRTAAGTRGGPGTGR